LKEDTQENIEKYQRSSLAYEKMFLDEINKRKKDPSLPIEERMLKSIKKTFERANVAIDSISRDDRRWGGSTYDKAKKTGFIDLYESSFRGGSHNVHGTWHDLEFNHIINNEGVFEPAIHYTVTKPQTIDSTTIICLIVTVDYINKIAEGCEDIINNINLLIKWFFEMEKIHENWLNTSQDK